ncbi:MAG: associated Golgi protein [Frankiales bacterium]|nr:associated Golgi protein [Frankiales bacterium]
MSLALTTAPTTLALGPEWLSPDALIGAGLAVLLLVVFVESGLLVGFFLPGDSLLFTAGLLINTQEILPLWLVVLTVPMAAIAGDQVGYLIGRKAGPRVFNRPDSRFFQQKYVDKAYGYFEKYGARTIVLARFVPIVRTFAPVVAGVSRMNYRTFVTYNVIGGVLWGAGVVLLGYFLGGVEFVAGNVEVIILAIVGISVLPIVFEVIRAARQHRGGPPTEGERQLPADVPTD